MDEASPKKFASRGGLKLDAALEHFKIDVGGAVCADLGCSTGGFVDCLLQRGAARVYAVDTAYGELAWKLRQDPRVVVCERTNAMHADPPPEAREACDIVTLDLGWTKQDKAIPAALRWLKPPEAGAVAGDSETFGGDSGGRIVTLIKPHYESGLHRLSEDEADAETRRVLECVLPSLNIPGGVEVLGWMRSPIVGGKGKNLEHLAVLRRG